MNNWQTTQVEVVNFGAKKGANKYFDISTLDARDGKVDPDVAVAAAQGLNGRYCLVRIVAGNYDITLAGVSAKTYNPKDAVSYIKEIAANAVKSLSGSKSHIKPTLKPGRDFLFV